MTQARAPTPHEVAAKSTITDHLPGAVATNNSATNTNLAMILDAYESPKEDLSHSHIFMSKLELAAFCRVFEFLDCKRVGDNPLYSRTKNSATRTRLAMILLANESPRKELSHAQIFMSKLELAAFCRSFEFCVKLTGRFWESQARHYLGYKSCAHEFRGQPTTHSVAQDLLYKLFPLT